jgi:hypothetical protein
LEALYKPGKGLRKDLDYCLASDASAPVGIERKSRLPLFRHLLPAKRLLFIAMDQVRSLRARDAYNVFRKDRCGGYIQIGESVPAIYGIHGSSVPESVVSYQNDEEVARANWFPTTLRRLTEDEYDLLRRRGYEACSAVLECAAPVEKS